MEDSKIYLKQRIYQLTKLLINRSIQEKKTNSEFRKTIHEKFDELEKAVLLKTSEIKRKDDVLTPKDILHDLQISRKTFDRWIIDGLKIMQRSPGSSIRVKREELEIYLNEKGYDGLF